MKIVYSAKGTDPRRRTERNFVGPLGRALSRVLRVFLKRRAALVAALSSLLTGCARAPSVDVLGSFFPVWMVCGSVAVILSFLGRKLLIRCKLESRVGPVALFYPSVVILFSCLLWLVFFR
jgi:YtcA family